MAVKASSLAVQTYRLQIRAVSHNRASPAEIIMLFVSPAKLNISNGCKTGREYEFLPHALSLSGSLALVCSSCHPMTSNRGPLSFLSSLLPLRMIYHFDPLSVRVYVNNEHVNTCAVRGHKRRPMVFAIEITRCFLAR